MQTLRRRLGLEGFLSPSESDDGGENHRLDGKLYDAVIEFQRRNGLEPDGVVGRNTLVALNVTAEARAAQIRLNLARLASMGARLEEPYIAVNIADQRLAFVRGAAVVFSEQVIVGRPSSPTPVLAAAIRSVTFNPSWYVPRAIALKEILPALRRNPDFLARENIVISGWTGDPHGADIDWRRARLAEYASRLRQLPGPGNALGLIKFDFPNPHDVYLHDTPAKRLFDARRRAFSHGCLRLQNPFLLATDLLSPQGWSPEALQQIIDSGMTRDIVLQTPARIIVYYATVFADAVGRIHFREDLYGWDAQGQTFDDLVAGSPTPTNMAAGEKFVGCRRDPV